MAGPTQFSLCLALGDEEDVDCRVFGGLCTVNDICVIPGPVVTVGGVIGCGNDPSSVAGR